MHRISANFVGRVQGVGFRATTRSIADAFDLTGWVRNEADGSVQLEAQGPQIEVEAFLGALRARLARNIRTSQVCAIPPRDERGPFEVRQ